MGRVGGPKPYPSKRPNLAGQVRPIWWPMESSLVRPKSAWHLSYKQSPRIRTKEEEMTILHTLASPAGCQFMHLNKLEKKKKKNEFNQKWKECFFLKQK